MVGKTVLGRMTMISTKFKCDNCGNDIQATEVEAGYIYDKDSIKTPIIFLRPCFTCIQEYKNPLDKMKNALTTLGCLEKSNEN